MGIKADHKYHGKVALGSELIESQSGSLGYQVMLECEDGATSYIVWLTAKNRERAAKTFTEALGVPEERLTDQSYIENRLSSDIAGREVTFVTEEEEYKGKSRIKVAWLFKRSSSSGGNPAKAAAAFFGGKSSKPEAVTPDNPITDDDIPF
jgi:hypothetical protein